jgi:hypothetical protein
MGELAEMIMTDVVAYSNPKKARLSDAVEKRNRRDSGEIPHDN